LHGIGGRTIAEAQENIGVDEYLDWVAYMNKRGGLNWGLRTERAVAGLTKLYHNANYTPNDLKIWDFTPHENEPPVSIEAAMGIWR